METKLNCGCGGNCTKNYIALSCSGGSDLGELTDKVTRKIRNELPNTSMNCLAKLGFGNQTLIDSISKEQALIIDGCPIDCGRKIMEKNGITNYKHFRLTDFGYVKGQTHITSEMVETTAKKIMDQI
jgi:uncharacterized metal-binding protein